MPDIFQFQFGPFSGSFIFDENGAIRLIPESDLKVSYTRNFSTHKITDFTIMTPDGTTYFFDVIEETTVVREDFFHDNDGNHTWQYNFLKVNLNESNSYVYRWQKDPYNSAWHLRKIITQGSTEEITFSYREEKQLNRAISNEVESENGMSPPFKTQTATAICITAKLPEEIIWPGGKITFTITLPNRYDTEKNSFHDYNNYALGGIRIYNNQEILIKGYDFSYSYFISDKPNFGSQYNNEEEQFSRRLKLDSLTEYHFNYESSFPIFLPSYIFSYNNSIDLPDRASVARDFWGFYKPNDSTNLFPSCYEYPEDLINDTTYFPSHFSIFQRPIGTYAGREVFHSGVNREADTNTCKAGILKEIEFPTGGSIRYIFESNEFFIQNTKHYGGGLRIKKIVLSPNNIFPSNENIITDFEYCNSGKIIDLPQFHSYSMAASDIIKHSQWDSKNALSKGGYVTYSKVRELTLNNGYTEYNFLQPGTFGTIKEDYDSLTNEYIYTRPTIFAFGDYAYLSTGYDFFPKPYNPNYDWKRGLLSSKVLFNQAGDTLKSITYSYRIVNYKKIPQIEASHMIKAELCLTDACTFKVSCNYSISPWIILDKEIEKEHFENHTFIKEKKYNYTSSRHHQITSKSENTSIGNLSSLKYKYVFDIDFSNAIANCRSSYLNCKETALNEYLQCKIECQSLSGIEKVNCELNCKDQYKIDTTVCITNYNSCLDGLELPEKARMIFKMQRNYMIGLPIEIQKLSDNLVIGGTIFEYHNFPGKHGPMYKKKVELSLNTNSSISNYQEFHLDENNNMVYDSHYYPAINYLKYDSIGNPAEIFKEDGIHVSYLWDYNLTLPVIKAENSSYDDLKAAVNLTNANFSTFLTNVGNMTTQSQKADWKLFNASLRNQLLLKNALVTTLTYKQLIGETSLTDPAGTTTYYEYDQFNRLFLIKDDNSNILKNYQYHYASQAK